jgi:micrococcal nuclease
MERATVAFWTLVLVLFGAAAFYALEVWQFQVQHRAQDLTLANGDVVTRKTVLEGDTLVVARGNDGAATVRLLGVRAFSSRGARDGLAVAARAAEETVRQMTAELPLRVLLHDPPKDAAGRTLATLFAGGDDVGLALVARGHALVDPAVPFAQLPSYRQAQQQAREQRLGLWADPAVAEQADSLLRRWARGAP